MKERDCRTTTVAPASTGASEGPGDGAPGLDKAFASVWDGVPVQRRTVHKHRNLLAHAPGTRRSPRTLTTRSMRRHLRRSSCAAQGLHPQMAAQASRRCRWRIVNPLPYREIATARAWLSDQPEIGGLLRDRGGVYGRSTKVHFIGTNRTMALALSA
jgi:hypothetical protein